jgi:FtsZ-binding cell division protein ZapB
MSGNLLSDTELDALAGLEDRIQKAVALVSSLRRERDAISSARDAMSKELQEARADVERLSGEVIALREERTQVRGRIEKLLGHIDQLSL